MSTLYLSRLIGLSAVLLVAALLVRGNALIMATVADGPVMLVYAIFSLAAGLAIILGHNVWSGGKLCEQTGRVLQAIPSGPGNLSPGKRAEIGGEISHARRGGSRRIRFWE